MKSAFRTAAVCAVVLVSIAGCSTEASDSGAEAGSAATASASPSSEQSPASTTTSSSSPGQLVIEVRIEGGAVSPTNERLEATVGEPIVLRVDSDTTDELHVHSVPDHSFEVDAASGQSFEFTVDVPGQVSIELHHSDRTVATVSVRP